VTAWDQHNFYRDKKISGHKLVLADIFEIKPVEMGEPAVAAPYRKMAATNHQVVGAGDMAVAALGGFHQLPEIIAVDLRKRAFFAHILDSGHKNPGCPAIVAGDLCLIWHGFDDLVGIFFTMVTIRTITRKDETVAHGR
jgi:hypothetical protein